MKPYFILLCSFCMGISLLEAQSLNRLSLADAYTAIKQHYPLLRADSLLEHIYDKELEKLALQRGPDLALRFEGRIQSETVSFPEESPVPINIDIPLYSYKPFLELGYSLYDGGIYQARLKQEKASKEVEKKSLEVEAYKLHQRINQLFVSIALYRAQKELIETSLNDLASRKESLLAAYENGVVLESEVSRLRVRELELIAKKEELDHRTRGSIETLVRITGLELAQDTEFVLPRFEEQGIPIPASQRPEQELFQLQKELLMSKEELLLAKHKPKLQIFAQGGAGSPNPLNLFDNNLSPFVLAGVSFQWKLSGRKEVKRDQEILKLRAQEIGLKKASFEFDLDSRESAYEASVQSLVNQIVQDREIAALQASILSQLATQLENGIITSVDYLIQSNAELRARQNLALHQIQLQQTHLEFLTLKGHSTF